MANYFIKEIYHKNRAMMNLDQLLNLYYLLSETIYSNVDGDVVELGTYRGLTALMMQKTLASRSSSKSLHLYDSFMGLPKKLSQDLVEKSHLIKQADYLDNQRIGQGWFQASLTQLQEIFAQFDAKLPDIHSGWFEETLKDRLPDKISFAHIDADLYSSTKCALSHVYPRLSKGAIIVIDDYCDPGIHKKQNTLPGVKRACDEFFHDKPQSVELLASEKEFHGVVYI